MSEYETALGQWSWSQPPQGQPKKPDPGEAKDAFGNARGGAFGTVGGKKSPEHYAALERIREWTLTRFSLPGDAGVLVSEVSCALPGCPPLETVVAFWTEPDKRYHFKMFKEAVEVTEDDLPFAWLKSTLLSPEGFGCECC
jgi:nitrate reductase delta subunit